MILKIQPSVSVPSKHGMSSFILCVVAGLGVRVDEMGMRLAMGEATGARRVRISFNFRDMV